MTLQKFLLLLLLFATPVHAQQQQLPPANAVASAQPMASAAGMEILAAGGNAFDAAIAVSAVLAVIEPQSSGFGGGGFWLLHRQQDGKQVMIDGREMAPVSAHRRMYRDADDNVIRSASINGPAAAAIPGMPAALVYLARHYGNLPLQKTLAAAIRHASGGFTVTPRYRDLVSYRLEVLQQYPSAAGIFLQDNRIPQLGYRIVQPDLARTIKALADEGRDGFYRGEVARLLVKGVQEHGGNWSLADLNGYRVVERAPIVTRYRDIRVVSAPPPSSGGIVLAQALQILSAFDLEKMTSIQGKHHVIEAMRRAYRDRAVYLGDPDYVAIPVARLLDRDYLGGLAMTIDPQQATPSDSIGDSPGLLQTGTETTHFSILDRAGNRVAATLSINLPFGSAFVAPGTGVVLNNEMDDFSSKPKTPNAYGLTGDQANAIEAGKRPLSSMTPTFLETDRRIGLLGTPGGSRIISMILLATLDFAAGHLPDSWVHVRRYHHQYRPDIVQYEKHGLTAYEISSLEGLGHRLQEKSYRYGNMHAIMWDIENSRVHAASDPRGEGRALVE